MRTDFSDGIGARYHVDNPCAGVHERKQAVGQQERSQVVYGYCVFEAFVSLDEMGTHGTGIVHQQVDAGFLGGYPLGHFHDVVHRGEVYLHDFDVFVLRIQYQLASSFFAAECRVAQHDDMVSGHGDGTSDFCTHASVGTGDDGGLFHWAASFSNWSISFCSDAGNVSFRC